MRIDAGGLRRKKCVPCEGGILRLTRAEAGKYLRNLTGWSLSENADSIRSEYSMKDFMAAVDFIDAVAGLAEKEGHHPDLHLTGYRRLAIELSTHAIRGLSENDFILAAKIDRLPRRLRG